MINFPLIIHNEKIKHLIHPKYDLHSLALLCLELSPALDIKLTENGFIKAAERKINSKVDPTHYDAVWIRDSMWAYLAFSVQMEKKSQALQILNGMLKYLSSPPQLRRLNSVIENPKISRGSPMDVLHIRFDPNSPTYDDVIIDGKPQYWNHKQNDALGLFLLCLCDAISEEQINPSKWTNAEVELFSKLPIYFEKISFFEMEDSGSWEEIERISTSSVSLVTAALERYLELVENDLLGLQKSCDSFNPSYLKDLIQNGYERIRGQMLLGESPEYPKNSIQYRESDAALLNVIYPACLFEPIDESLVLDKIVPLIGEVGICRYLGDSYQSAGFWNNFKTDDCSAEQKFLERSSKVIQETEAQWFFDSWLSKIYGMLFLKTHKSEFYEQQTYFFNRAVGQLTGPGQKAADGSIVSEFCFPESYNVAFTKSGERIFLPSPITPLNWAKASMILSIDQMRKSLFM